jgi:hypothetical protein
MLLYMFAWAKLYHPLRDEVGLSLIVTGCLSAVLDTGNACSSDPFLQATSTRAEQPNHKGKQLLFWRAILPRYQLNPDSRAPLLRLRTPPHTCTLR